MVLKSLKYINLNQNILKNVASLCLGNVSKDFSVFFYFLFFFFFFSVYYDNIDVNDILDIFKYLMVKNHNK